MYGPTEENITSFARVTVEAKFARTLLARSFWPGRAHCSKWAFKKNEKNEGSGGSASKPAQEVDGAGTKPAQDRPDAGTDA